MDEIGGDIVQQTLIVCDDNRRILLGLQFIHTAGNDTQSIDVQPAVGLIENGKTGFEHSHLEYLVPFLFSARKTLVYRATGQFIIQLHNLPLFPHKFQEIGSRQWFKASVLALLVHSRAHKINYTHTRYLHRILKTQKYTFVRTILG